MAFSSSLDGRRPVIENIIPTIIVSPTVIGIFQGYDQNRISDMSSITLITNKSENDKHFHFMGSVFWPKSLSLKNKGPTVRL